MYASTDKAQKDGRQAAARRLDAVVVPPISFSASSRQQVLPCGQPPPPARGCGPWMHRGRPSRRVSRSRPGISGRRSSAREVGRIVSRCTGSDHLAIAERFPNDFVGCSVARCNLRNNQKRIVSVVHGVSAAVLLAYPHCWQFHFSFSDGAYLHLSTHRVPQAACAVNYYFSGLPRGGAVHRHNPSRQGTRACERTLDGVVQIPNQEK